MMRNSERLRQLGASARARARQLIFGPPLTEDAPPKSEPVKRLIAASRSIATWLHAFDELGLVSEDHRLIFTEKLGIHLVNKLYPIEQYGKQNFLDRLAWTAFDEIVHYTKSNLPIPTDGPSKETAFLRAFDQAAKDTVTLLDKRGLRVKLQSLFFRCICQNDPLQELETTLAHFNRTGGIIQETRAMYAEKDHRANIELFKPESSLPSGATAYFSSLAFFFFAASTINFLTSL